MAPVLLWQGRGRAPRPPPRAHAPVMLLMSAKLAPWDQRCITSMSAGPKLSRYTSESTATLHSLETAAMRSATDCGEPGGGHASRMQRCSQLCPHGPKRFPHNG